MPGLRLVAIAIIGVPALLIVPPRAHALDAGITLSWNHCVDDPGSAGDLRFACDTNDRGAPFRLVAEVVPDHDLTEVLGVETVLLVRFSGTTIPDWWALGSGGCRLGAMTQEAPLSASGGTGCAQWLGTGLSTGVLFSAVGASGVQVTATWSNPDLVATTLLGGTRYVATIFDLDQTRTLGAPECPGCETQATLSLGWVRILQQSDSWAYLTPQQRGSVTWQGTMVPTRNRSWGAIKALYR